MLFYHVRSVPAMTILGWPEARRRGVVVADPVVGFAVEALGELEGAVLMVLEHGCARMVESSYPLRVVELIDQSLN